MNDIFKITERKWNENLDRFGNTEVQYLLLAEAPPWTECGEVKYFYNTFDGKWTNSVWKCFFPDKKRPEEGPSDINKGLQRLAHKGFLLIDTLPFAMNYSNVRGKSLYPELIRCCKGFLTEKISNEQINWAADVKLAFAFKLNGRYTIKSFHGRLPIKQGIKLDENLIAADESGYTNSKNLRNIFKLK